MFNYKKVIVIGCPGAGKSTFSRKLHDSTNLDLFHLDALYWNEDCTHISREELIKKQEEIFKQESFIIDGNFKSTLEMRVKEADVVFLFDLPTEICIKGAKNRKGNRPEMPCELPDNDKLIDFILNFNTEVMPKIQYLLKKYNSNVIIFHSHKEADEYILNIKSELWDAYDESFNIIDNVTLVRGQTIPDGMFHLVCNIAVKHIDGTYLIMQRDFKKHFGGMWELTAGGSALKGETPIECAKRELKEETGIICNGLQELGAVTSNEDKTIYVDFLCVTDCDKKSIILQEGETVDFRWVSANDIKKLSSAELVTKRMQGFIDEL